MSCANLDRIPFGQRRDTTSATGSAVVRLSQRYGLWNAKPRLSAGAHSRLGRCLLDPLMRRKIIAIEHQSQRPVTNMVYAEVMMAEPFRKSWHCLSLPGCDR